MRAVLGIDAAWTEKEPSGVALVKETATGWECVALAPSYRSFLDAAEPVDWHARHPGSTPNPAALLAAAERILGNRVTVVAVDMPLAVHPITARRPADDAISYEFGRYWCSTHSPGLERPGEISTRLVEEFARARYPLLTTAASVPATPCLIEVYPHPALLALLNEKLRLPYKVSKSRRYWKDSDLPERRVNLVVQFDRILSGLKAEIGGISLTLPDPALIQMSRLKAWEDALDALVCAWVGIAYLAGRAIPYGDASAAIWVPKLPWEESAG